MSLIFRPLDEANARAFLSWRYEAPYDIYNPNPDKLENDVQYFIAPQTACYSISDERGGLVGFCSFGLDGRVPGGDYSADALDIGMGIRPDLTGRGQGSMYVEAVLDFVRRTFAPSKFRVTIAEFNERALRVWEKAGFRRVQTFQKRQTDRTFVILTRRDQAKA